MHIMVNKRYMQKCDACVGHEARMNKLLFKEAPRFNERGWRVTLRAFKSYKRERERKKRNARQKIYKKWIEEGDEHRVRH